MSKVLVNETSLSGIANSIRAKNGTETTYKPSEMAAAIDAIQTGGDIPEEAFVLSESCEYMFYNGKWDWFINMYGNHITTENIKNAQFMFSGCETITNIPFEINFKIDESYINTNYLFSNCRNLTEVQKLNNLSVYNTNSLLKSCKNLRTIPDNFADTWNWSYLEKQTSSYTGDQSSTFVDCFSLRNIPTNIMISGNPFVYFSYSYFYNGFTNCYALDELVNLPIPYTKATWTSNSIYNTFSCCSRIKNITFALQEDSTPYVVNWKSQTIDLTKYVGYLEYKTYILNYNSGITADKEVTDDATYQALKNDPDWFTCDSTYSRYNHDSAVATINSLPDTSAYLATAGGTNTIKFKGAAGSATDGGAINTLTEEEIAVATSRGWTVTLA